MAWAISILIGINRYRLCFLSCRIVTSSRRPKQIVSYRNVLLFCLMQSYRIVSSRSFSDLKRIASYRIAISGKRIVSYRNVLFEKLIVS